MKLTIFGATGPSGQLLVNKALAAGHEVTAFARTPSKLAALSEGRSEKLHVVSGELTDAASIETAITGADVVISLLGPTGKSKGTPVADGTRLIVAAMEKYGVKRLVATATPSAQDASDGSSWSFALAVKAIKAFVGSAYQEIVATADVVRASSLDWTLVRLPMLTNKPAPRAAKAGYVGDPGIRLFSLSRDALADFLLAEAEDKAWLRKAPVVSNG